MNKVTFDSIDWKDVDSSDVPWHKNAAFASESNSQQYKLFKKWYDQAYPSGSRGLYHTKYVKLIGKAKCLKLF